LMGFVTRDLRFVTRNPQNLARRRSCCDSRENNDD
jgi:hypothetical protein